MNSCKACNGRNDREKAGHCSRCYNNARLLQREYSLEMYRAFFFIRKARGDYEKAVKYVKHHEKNNFEVPKEEKDIQKSWTAGRKLAHILNQLDVALMIKDMEWCYRLAEERKQAEEEYEYALDMGYEVE